MLQKIDSKRLLMLLLAVFLTFSSIFSASFAAVPADYVSPWAKPIEAKAQTYGLLPSTLDGQDLTVPISRIDYAKTAVLLYEKATGKTAALPAVEPFDDTKDIDILKAYALGIVRGVGAGVFSPEASITREQAAVMLARTYMKISGSRLMAAGIELFNDDGDISAYAKPSVYYMVYKGFIQGTGSNFFKPKGVATREQAMAMAVRMFESVKGTIALEPIPEYSPGMKAESLDHAIEIIKNAEKDLAPEITMAIEKELYEGLLTSPFVEETGIDSLHYVYNANTGSLSVKLTYSLYAQILALSTNPGLAGIYATNEAKNLNGVLDEILSEIITLDMGIYDKEKAVHDYMVTHYQYDSSLTEYDLEHPSMSVSGLIYHKQGGCKAYAEMFNILISKLGIGTKMVYGFAGDDEHVWNMVRLAGDWYMVDVTWDDPAPDRGMEISYEYFNVTDDVISKDHTWDKEDYPACNSTEYSYINMQ